jgi:hypothetical protein
MPRYSKRSRNWKSIVRGGIIPVLAIACVAALLYQELAFRHRQKTTWTTVTATIEQTRIHPIARYALEYGSKDLYEVDVLTSYSVNGVQRDDWVPLSEAPQSLAKVQSATQHLKGRQCLVRWDPSSPDQKIADLR